MDSFFAELMETLVPKLDALMNSEPYRHGSLPRGMPPKGIYLFSENDVPLYVGRSNKLRNRYRGHCSPGATHHSATFALILARIETNRLKASYKPGPDSVKGLMAIPSFNDAFQRAKARIRTMDYRFIEETDQNRQALLEIYCAVVLRTPHNDFGTH